MMPKQFLLARGFAIKETWKTIERITNIAVIVVFIIFLAGFLFKSYETHQSQAPRIGESLPELTGYSWKANPRSIVLVLRKGCRFCDESMPFYRTLYDLERDRRLSATMVAVFPDKAEEVNEILRAQNLPIPAISQVDPARVKVAGTPTLILVDQNRKVERTWVGELDSAGRSSVIKALQNSIRAMDGNAPPAR